MTGTAHRLRHSSRRLLRWSWRQLTSMRAALFLLLLLALAAVPGSLFPQRVQSSASVAQYIQERGQLGQVMDWLKLFDVYSSPWFSAIYLLLFISLIGCVIPRTRAHVRALRTRPPGAPRRLSTFPHYGAFPLAATPSGPDGEQWTPNAVAQTVRRHLRARHYRVVLDEDGGRTSVAGERGYLKELGNLVFHTCLIGVLVSVAVDGLFGYSGQRVLVTGDTFVNTLASYDTFSPGTNFQADWLQPYSLTLDKFDVVFNRSAETGKTQPLDFTAQLTAKETAQGEPQRRTLKVNEPVSIGGNDVYLLGNGYAPHMTVRDGQGNVAFSDWVPGKLSSPDYTSSLTVKVPDAQPEQLGFVGLLLPTARQNAQGVDVNQDPDPLKPVALLNSYYGDVGLDRGVPQNVYVLDTSSMTPLNDRTLPAGAIRLPLGQSYQLPEGKGSITFDNLTRYIGVEVRSNPAQKWVLVFSLLALGGLVLSLFCSRRRVWLRAATHPDGRVMVEYAFLARGQDHRLGDEAHIFRAFLKRQWPRPPTAGDPGGLGSREGPPTRDK